MLALAALQRRIHLHAPARRLAGIALAAAALCACAGGLVLAGGPGKVAGRAHSPASRLPAGKRRRPQPARAQPLQQRAGQRCGRPPRQTRRHPLLGSGAGTYEGFFYEHRNTAALNVRDAHNLYLETLAELGPAGLALLAFALGLPLVAAVRSRADGVAAGSCRRLHRVPRPRSLGLGLGAAHGDAGGGGVCSRACSRARGARDREVLARRTRVAMAAVLVVPAAFAALAVLGNRATTAAQQAAASGDWSRAAAEARRAGRFAPWASDPLPHLSRRRGWPAATSPARPRRSTPHCAGPAQLAALARPRDRDERRRASARI